MQAARIFEECDGGFPAYREAVLKVREATTNFFQGSFLIAEDVAAMIQDPDSTDSGHIDNYRRLFQGVLQKLTRYVFNSAYFFARVIGRWEPMSRDVGPMYDQRFLQPVEMEIGHFPDTRDRIQQRLEDLVEHHHYRSKLESMARNIHKNPEDRTVRNQHKFAQLTVLYLLNCPRTPHGSTCCLFRKPCAQRRLLW